MLFNSLEFLWFFPLIVVGFYGIPHRFRTLYLLGASLWFYMMWKPAFVIVLLCCIAVAYVGGVGIRRSGTKVAKKAWLLGSSMVPILMLLVFKYYNFFAETVTSLGRRMDSSIAAPALRLALPIGISFFTFKAISYLVDVYRGTIATERNPLKLATYISFFPQVLAGPIERAGNLMPQLSEVKRLDTKRITDGLALMLWGLFKKAVIADQLAVYVSYIYGSPTEYQGIPLILATYFYAFQIYCDFSGYSDMAIGAARVLGFSTMKNFDLPYISSSVGEFWRRWHISLSTWFRDYIYIPLGGSRVPAWKWARNVLLVFLVSGLWHGAAWTFIIWGGLHGAFLLAERYIRPPVTALWEKTRLSTFPALTKTLGILVTFHLVSFSWIFFRAQSVSDALYIVSNLFAGFDRNLSFVLTVFKAADLFSIAFWIALLILAHFIQKSGSALQWLRNRSRALRWAVYAALVLAIINFRPEFQAEFIYLQF